MKCPFNIKAANGQNSELFKSILDTTSNIPEAVDLYYYTKTDEFKRVYGDWENGKVEKSKLDKNGEPAWSSLSKEAYVYDVDYNKIELNSRADTYKEIAKLKPKLEKAIKDKLELLKARENPEYADTVKDLESLLKIVEDSLLEVSVPKFLNNSKEHIAKLWNLTKKAANAEVIDLDTIKKLSGYAKAAKSYTVLTQLQSLLMDNPDIRDILQVNTNINKTLGDIAEIDATYISRSKRFVARDFAERRAGWTEKQVMEWLNQAPTDTAFLENMLGYIGDAADPILAMTGNIVMEAEHKVRRASIDFNYELEAVLKKVEKKYPNQKSEDLFSDIIYENEEGELHVLDLAATFTDGKIPSQDAMYNKVQALKGKPEIFEFFEFFYTQYAKLQNMLPAGARLGTRLPMVTKAFYERLEGKNLKEKVKLLHDDMKKKILSSNLDKEHGLIVDSTGEPVKRIPIYYNEKYDSVEYDKLYKKKYGELIAKNMEEKDAIEQAVAYAEKEAIKMSSKFVTRDLAFSLQAFHSMAMNFSAKNEIISVLDSVSAIVGSENRSYIKLDNNGEAVTDSNGDVVTESGNHSNAAKFLTKFLDMHVFGKRDLDLGQTNTLIGKVDAAKVLRMLNNSTSVIQLAGNLFAGLPNVGNGEYQSFMESVGGEHYKITNYRKVGRLYGSNLPGILKDVGARNPANLVNLLDQRYNMMQEFWGKGNIKASEQNSAKRLLKTNLLFFINNIGEHFMQIKAAMAAMDATMTYSKSGNETGSLLDAHSEVNGRLQIKEGLYVKDVDGKLVKYDDKQQDRMSHRMNALNRKLFGNYNHLTANAAKQDARLALFLKFRDWAYEGAMRRYSRKRPNLNLEQDVEGFYRTGWRVAKTMIKDLKQLRWDLMKEDWDKLTVEEKANIRRLVTEAAAVTALGAAAGLLAYAGKHIEDEFNSDDLHDRMVLGSFRLLVYETDRLQTELMSYWNPAETLRVLRSPMASTSILANTANLLTQLFTDPLEQYETGWRKGEYKSWVRAGKLIPLYKHLSVLNPDGIKDKGIYYKL